MTDVNDTLLAIGFFFLAAGLIATLVTISHMQKTIDHHNAAISKLNEAVGILVDALNGRST